MNYDLAKKLKDAGFPQTGQGKWWIPGYDVAQWLLDSSLSKWSDQILAYQPTLSELIEACEEAVSPINPGSLFYLQTQLALNKKA